MGRSFPIGYFTALLSGSQHCRTVYYLPVQHEKIHVDTAKLRDLPQYLPAHIPFLFASLSHHFSVKVLDGSQINVNLKCKSIPCTLGAWCTGMSVAMRIEFLTSFGFLTRLRATCLPRTPQIILVLQKRPCEAWEGAGFMAVGFWNENGDVVSHRNKPELIDPHSRAMELSCSIHNAPCLAFR